MSFAMSAQLHCRLRRRNFSLSPGLHFSALFCISSIVLNSWFGTTVNHEKFHPRSRESRDENNQELFYPSSPRINTDEHRCRTRKSLDANYAKEHQPAEADRNWRSFAQFASAPSALIRVHPWFKIRNYPQRHSLMLKSGFKI